MAASLVAAVDSADLHADEPLTDRVVIRGKGRNSRITLQCAIIDYTGRGITLRTVVGTVRSFPTAAIVDVRTAQSPHHVRGLIAFTQGKYQQAASFFEDALRAESRKWVKREILAFLVKCGLQTGDLKSATQRFLRLVKSDPTTRHFSLIPLTWAAQTLDADQKAIARGWLSGSDSVAKLIAASRLLHDAKSGRSAETALKQLSTDINTQVSRLAQIQLWRKRLLGSVPKAYELSLLRKEIARLPKNLRGGGYYLLGQGHLRRKENEQAAAALLWVPLVYDHDRLLAARACLEAADALNGVGRTTEAVTLYRELQQRFGDTKFAREAAARLSESGKPGKTR